MRLDFLFITKASWPEPSLSFWQKFNGHLLTIFQKFLKQYFKNLPFSTVLVFLLAARTLLWGRRSWYCQFTLGPSVFPDSTPDHSNSPDSHTTETKPGWSYIYWKLEDQRNSTGKLFILRGMSLPAGFWQPLCGGPVGSPPPTGSFRHFSWESKPICFLLG